MQAFRDASEFTLRGPFMKEIGISLIVAGVVVLNLFSNTVSHP